MGVPSNQLMGPMPMFLTAIHEREREHAVPSNAPNMKLCHDTPDLSAATEREREPVIWNQEELEVQGEIAERTLGGFTERANDHIGEGTYDVIRSERSGGEFPSLRSIPICTDLS